MTITAHRSVFLQLCSLRSYQLEEVRACIVSENGDQITVDETHPAYPRGPKPGFQQPAPKIGPELISGPGTELKKLLAGWPFRIVATPNCSCNAKAAEMDRRGIQWCEANLDTIVEWLREEAGKRGLPFVDMAGRLLVKRAIRNARRAAS